jgi:hypothetical protein
MVEELVLRVEGSKSSVVQRAELSAVDLREREHLQEWILDHPEILGIGTTVLTSELADWQTAGGQRVLDRLDVLGLDPDGRLVVAELKRGAAPHSVHMQAVSYAAMVSRLKISDVAEMYAKARSAAGVTLDLESAREELETQLSLTEDKIRNPRIVLVASDFPPSVTSSVVWLRERDVDISLVRFRTYRLEDGTVIVSFARLLPVADVEDYTIARGSARIPAAKVTTEPGPAWDSSSLAALALVGNPTTLALLDLCAQADNTPVTVAAIQETTGLSTGQVRGQLAGFTMLLKNPKYGVAPNVWPVAIKWQAGGVANYFLPEDLASQWRKIRGLDLPASPTAIAPAFPDDGPQ